MVQIEKVRKLQESADRQTDIARRTNDLVVEMGEAAQVVAADYRIAVEELKEKLERIAQKSGYKLPQ